MTHAVIVDFVRTPFTKASGKTQGKLAGVDPVDMLATLTNALIDRTGINPADVRKILTGAVHQEFTQGLNIARLSVLHKDSKLPNTVGGTTLDRFCGSSMEAIAMADAFIARDPDAVYICNGVQSMSQIPMGGYNIALNSNVFAGNAKGFMDMGVTAENLATLYKIDRVAQDRFAVESHAKAAKGRAAGNTADEIVTIAGVSKDDGIREGDTYDGLAKLKTVFKDEKSGGTVTAGTASQVTDGATAVIVTSEAYAQKNNLPIKARILAFGECGCAPEIMGIGPVEATKDALKRANLTMADIDIVELNEAFAAQSLAVLEEFNRQGMNIDPAKINLDGGAIALGHPLGASGARLVGHVANVLKRENKRYGLATMCIGGGQGVAMIVENPAFKP